MFFNLFAAAEPSVNVSLLMEPYGIGQGWGTWGQMRPA